MDWKFLKTLRFKELNLDKEDQDILNSLANRLQDNYPYHSQLYAGQMIKPPHPLAQAAQWMASFVNPNNHALDGGRATSGLELEVVAELGQLMGYKQALGHLTSGGTMANLEALWISRKIDSNTTVLANELAHYTHSRMTEVLGIPFKSMPADVVGRMDLPELKRVLTELKSQGKHATIVATLGTTGTGSIDPLEDIIILAKQFDARVHVDAAYGGYFKLAELEAYSKSHFQAIQHADSIVIDPHKHGLQPYGCGAVLFKDPSVGRFYKHDSPYTYFTSTDLHLGEITLECSRSGAAAAGVWATM
ncbi:aminotransferase class I/II-fold pyridoxal phosphate-dependent enzyme, partial [Schleiferiaceae bacterium]|nr:aminotransferase class I/II-fold pyridoxal phosphate-dependent enzyme [Schleiferiaceae bacterium]